MIALDALETINFCLPGVTPGIWESASTGGVAGVATRGLYRAYIYSQSLRTTCAFDWSRTYKLHLPSVRSLSSISFRYPGLVAVRSIDTNQPTSLCSETLETGSIKFSPFSVKGWMWATTRKSRVASRVAGVRSETPTHSATSELRQSRRRSRMLSADRHLPSLTLVTSTSFPTSSSLFVNTNYSRRLWFWFWRHGVHADYNMMCTLVKRGETFGALRHSPLRFFFFHLPQNL